MWAYSASVYTITRHNQVNELYPASNVRLFTQLLRLTYSKTLTTVGSIFSV